MEGAQLVKNCHCQWSQLVRIKMGTVSRISSVLLSSLILSSPKPKLIHHPLLRRHTTNYLLLSNSTTVRSSSVRTTKSNKHKSEAALAKEKRRTRSNRELDDDALIDLFNNNSLTSSSSSEAHQVVVHVPVMLAEVLDVFSNCSLSSFVDCTLGAAGHSSAVSTTPTQPNPTQSITAYCLTMCITMHLFPLFSLIHCMIEWMSEMLIGD